MTTPNPGPAEHISRMVKALLDESHVIMPKGNGTATLHPDSERLLMTAAHEIRRRQLAAIHIGKKALQMTDDTYREMLRTVAGVDSSAKLDDVGFRVVLDHMRSLGFVDGKARRSHKGRPRNMDSPERGNQLKKVEAMLLDANLTWAYADGIAKRMFGIERVSWCDSQQLRAIITALVKKAQREGRRSK